MLLTSFANDQAYRSEAESMARLETLVNSISDKKFCAKAAIYARTKFGMRSITHVLASNLAKHVSGQEWAKSFYQKVVDRPDDITEILAHYISKNGKPITNAMKKGLGAAFGDFDEYALAKYRGEGKAVKLVDAVNLLHPKGPQAALKKLVAGKLKNKKTWEAKLTKAGQKAETEEEKEELKADAWESLIKTRQLGYFALLRNLRNIIEQAPDVLEDALEMLVDPKLIKNSKVLPFRFLTAYQELQKVSGNGVSKTLRALSEAIDISCENVPEYGGRTCVVLDTSGSMEGQPIQIGALFAAVLAKASDADVMTFSNDAQYRAINPADSTLTIAQNLGRLAAGGTNFHAIFEEAKEAYDRIIILSDMQGWIGGHAPTATFTKYKKRTGADPMIFSFDLQGYGTLQFPERNVFCLAGFSEKTLELLEKLEVDRNALIKEIEAIKL